ncbi:sucrose-specific PTS transporter subunit IIBC [Halobacillus sp. A5]|uniref:sucrose-specific PTS transporter subunit IIBC n=1 Tax=Halobacillus sp. A5 TaxID=2880263 RepID=UPI0020A6D9B3|nr:sucrose-specific PTS transporter subunit IIBC [Halobacillus sp. A5]MCP3028001.1 sucrose-specific PTS transporter subunit IIBC [Halobacillus sp. A5]
MASNNEIAKQVIEAVGGESNIQSIAHCATRLRVMVHDREKVDVDTLEEIEKVKGAFYNSGQYQIIFGTGTVNQIYQAVMEEGVEGSSKSEMKEEAAKQGTAFQRAIRTFGDVFVPIIPVLVATGLFMGLRGLLLQETFLEFFGLTPDTVPENVVLFTQVLTDTAFVFLPALVAWSTFKVFGGTPVIGLVLGLMLVSPSLPDAWAVAEGNEDPIYFLDFIPIVGYQGSVLPAFFAGLIGAKLEKWCRKRIPEALDLILTPFIVLLVMIALSLFIIGPILHIAEDGIFQTMLFLLELPFGLSGLIIGLFHQIIVITGVHHIFNFLEIQLFENLGYNPFNPVITGAIAAQGGAALAVGVKTSSAKLKAIAYPSSLSAFLGITEPAIFGVNLRYMKPFVMGLIGGGVSGFLASIFNLQATGLAITVIPGSLLYLNEQIFGYIIVNLVAIGTAFVLTYLFGFSDKMLDRK